MPVLNLQPDQLRSMIGLRVRYHGVYCHVVEVLEDEIAIVLEDLEYHMRIQPDQHGEAHRKVPETYIIQIFSSDLLEFTPHFLSIDPLD